MQAHPHPHPACLHACVRMGAKRGGAAHKVQRAAAPCVAGQLLKHHERAFWVAWRVRAAALAASRPPPPRPCLPWPRLAQVLARVPVRDWIVAAAADELHDYGGLTAAQLLAQRDKEVCTAPAPPCAVLSMRVLPWSLHLLKSACRS